MHLRESLINLSITVALVCVVAVLALVLRGQRPATVSMAPQNVTRAVPVVPTAVAQPLVAMGHQRSATRVTFSDPKLLDHPDNLADSLKMRVGNEELRFCLYYVSAYATTADRPDTLKVQANRSIKVDPVAMGEVRRDALRFTMDLLSKHPWKLHTYWDRHSDGQRYYAMIEVQLDKTKSTYLAEQLVRQGYAMVSGFPCELPGVSQAEYLGQLKKSSTFAQSKKLGLWAKVKS
jgi:hypothetical protein